MISMACVPKPVEEETQIEIDVHDHADSPIRYASLERVYSVSSSSLCCLSAAGSHSVMFKKVKAQKVPMIDPFSGDGEDAGGPCGFKLQPRRWPEIIRVYSRRKRPRRQSFMESVLTRKEGVDSKGVVVKTENVEFDENCCFEEKQQKKRRIGNGELVKLGVDSSILSSSIGPRLRDCRNNNAYTGKKENESLKKKRGSAKNLDNLFPSASAKRWVRLSYDGADPISFVGLQCKVFWPLDADWYAGSIVGYNLETNRHRVKYEDNDEEALALDREKIKFFLSREEMEGLNLKLGTNDVAVDGRDYDEMVVLAATLEESQDFEPGDIIWAKLTGHAMWPAIIVDESVIGKRKGLNKVSGGRSVLVQFFGTHDFARIRVKQVISFLKGLLSSFHLKCKQPRFEQGMEEAKMYLSEHKLPARMLQLRNEADTDDSESTNSAEEDSSGSGEDCINNGEVWLRPGRLGDYLHIIDDLRIVNLGKIVTDSKFFKDDKHIWPEGYTAMRKFVSLKDSSISALYKMEVLRDAESKTRPLFRVTADSGEQFKGSSPSSCWNKIYNRIRKIQSATDGPNVLGEGTHGSGTDMFGFSNPEVNKLIQGLLKSRPLSKFASCKHSSGRYQDLPVGYRPVRVDWKDLDKCNVCHMDEEYENNLFLQCDKCRMMVHAKCYGELEPRDGVLWLCNLCRPEAPNPPPPCCLCPVVGGAMKPTTDGRWAHLACAIWIPETCLSDVKKMEPIDGLSRVSKDRWKLLCSICGVSYGACIQCSNNTCRVAYHPLCARAAGLCVELEDEERHYLLSMEDDEPDQCIRLLSFCKRHRQASNDHLEPEDRMRPISQIASEYVPPPNPSGCARTEPYNYFGRRGRKEPEALAAASSKRLFVENQPYIVSGHCLHEFSTYKDIHGSKLSQMNIPSSILSMAEKYTYMKETYRKRLAFGKSGIHGFGIFAKLPHRAGDMVIEYTGELVRPSIADKREHLIYNSLVGAGTYMFRIDDERVVDATRAGSIAHLINHSCEPNCYSRVISVNGDEHIIIFAKRDIERWEELTYDYRFFSVDEHLSCYCGFPGCRGVVNDTEAEEQLAKIHAPRCELIDWNEE
ncbi:PREDICTED: histone-lysine N-methyltransferase ATX2 isoform X2 [Tarenaya hassleriana]|uniref:histone-lysine N-methyltransferase ATX2 isoform X2 n=1 Tax=Tarenaya hassleriana TaxID=28532 RepID=UPI00053C520E|nr:PREDICTED: histone-lysine N-methyltransferase ATX2 isoform X2 [Tarenaya hassleriana]